MASLRFMEMIAIFFVFDFAINYLSALLRAMKEQSYLLKVTAGVAAGFALVNLALPLLPDIVHLMGAFITAQAIWALLLLIRVIRRWPDTASQDLAAHRAQSVKDRRHRVDSRAQGPSDRPSPAPPWPRMRNDEHLLEKSWAIRKPHARSRPTAS